LNGCWETIQNKTTMRLVLPRLYVILDAALIPSYKSEVATAASLAEAGVRLLQYRNKRAAARELWQRSRALAEELGPRDVVFVVNDRPDVAMLAGAQGVHVGQEDLEVESARRVVGPEKWVGGSTHNLEQFQEAASSSADYIAVGPIFATSSKANPDPVVGLELLRRARVLTDKPIVAIGGIGRERAAEAIEAGADSVAVISGILRAVDPAAEAQGYLEVLRGAKSARAL
jgi:thiamine-phosphate pyrophosphorylase